MVKNGSPPLQLSSMVWNFTSDFSIQLTGSHTRQRSPVLQQIHQCPPCQCASFLAHHPNRQLRKFGTKKGARVSEDFLPSFPPSLAHFEHGQVRSFNLSTDWLTDFT